MMPKLPPLPEVGGFVYDESGLMLSASEEAAVERLLLAYGKAIAEACAEICNAKASKLYAHAKPPYEDCAAAIREAAKEIGKP